MYSFPVYHLHLGYQCYIIAASSLNLNQLKLSWLSEIFIHIPSYPDTGGPLSTYPLSIYIEIIYTFFSNASALTYPSWTVSGFHWDFDVRCTCSIKCNSFSVGALESNPIFLPFTIRYFVFQYSFSTHSSTWELKGLYQTIVPYDINRLGFIREWPIF